MTDQQLHERLSEVIPPSGNQTSTERSLTRALMAFRNSQKVKTEVHGLWKYGLAFALIAIAAIIFLFQIPEQTGDSPSHLLAEMESLFPGQLNAIIRTGSETDISLNEVSDGARSSRQQLQVFVESEGEVTEILTYSGSEVNIPFRSGFLRFTPLFTADGEVLILTEETVFLGSGQVESTKIKARGLSQT